MVENNLKPFEKGLEIANNTKTTITNGSKQIQALQDAGFSKDVIQNHVQEKSDALLQGGFSAEDVNNYFGYKEPNTKKIEQYWTDGIKDYLFLDLLEDLDLTLKLLLLLFLGFLSL